MIVYVVYVLFLHKKSVSKRKVCIIFIKNKKIKKINIFSGIFRWFFGVFLGGFFIANPAQGLPAQAQEGLREEELGNGGAAQGQQA
jgi:hypothetical protein